MVSTDNRRRWTSKPLFEDPDFPADFSVLYRGGQRSGVLWKRPWEISQNPVFSEDGISYSDIDQGDLGNCWFLSSVACLAVSPQKDLIHKIIPKGQGFGPEYTGKFTFRFWQYGKWVDVVVDDRLPTYRNNLIYSRNVDQPHEYWVPLLEKAFAKLYGNYNVLDGGRIHTALVDLTGGFGEMVRLKQQITDGELTDLLLRCQAMKSFMGGSIFISPTGRSEGVLESGLVEGHAYTIVKVKEVNTSKGRFVLLHIRNPHGRGEWKGDWSDYSSLWKSLSEEDQKETSETENNGEFWINVSDFRKHFDELELCHLSPEALTEGSTGSSNKVQWKSFEHSGQWSEQSSGGPPISLMSQQFWSNPQIELRVPPSSQLTPVVISLFEVNDFLRRQDTDISIGFSVFQFPSGTKTQRLTAENYYEFSPRMVKSSGVYWPYRELTRRFLLESADYIIVPYTSRAGQQASFYLRIFTESTGPSRVTTNEVVEKPTPAPNSTTVLSKEKAALYKAFDAVTKTEGAVDAVELVEVLSAGISAAENKTVKLSVETCRSLLSYCGTNSPKGLLDRKGLDKLWIELTTWREAFRLIDKDKNKSINAKELQSLFEIIEVTTWQATVGTLMKRYGGKSEKISQDDFLQGVCRALQLRRKYLELQRKGKIDIDFNEWMTFGLAI